MLRSTTSPHRIHVPRELSPSPPSRGQASGTSRNPVWQIVAGLNDRSSIVSVGDPPQQTSRLSALSMLSERDEPAPEVPEINPHEESRDFFKQARVAPLDEFDFGAPSGPSGEEVNQQGLSGLMSSLNIEPSVVASQGKGVLVCRDGDSEPTNVVYKDEDEIPMIMDQFAQGNSAARFEFHRLSRFTGQLEEFVPNFQGNVDTIHESTSEEDFEDPARVEQRIIALLRPGGSK